MAEFCSDIVSCGYLEKRSLHLRQWRKRWAVLKKDGQILFYKTESMKNEPTEIINIIQYTAMQRNNQTFSLNSDDKRIQKRVFRCENKSMYDQWVNNIKTVIVNSKEYIMKHGRKDGMLNDDDQYIHNVQEEKIYCPYLLKSNTTQPLNCPIYFDMQQRYKFSKESFDHLSKYKHFKYEYKEKPKCKYGNECKTYIRSEKGIGNNEIDQKCHMKLYCHPPRTRQIKLAANIHSFIVNKKWISGDQRVFKPTKTHKEKYKYNSKDGYLQALIKEVISNGYAYDLCLKCGQNDECKHNVNDKQNEYSILKIVDEKMNHNRHKLMGLPLTRDQMLALVLYTGCECNYDLCAIQRNGWYAKWVWFDYCLFWAVKGLSSKEIGEFSVYTGLNGVKLNEQNIERGYFVTYVSTSWRKDVATAFMGGKEGMIMEIDQKYKNLPFILCCDVSWISKFPDECEILFARADWDHNGFSSAFSCVILDESNGIQTVSLK